DSHTRLGLACLLTAWLHPHLHSPAQEAPMALRFLGKDPDSPQGGSPSLWDDGDSYVIQGWRVEDTATLSELLRSAGQQQIQAGEDIRWLPRRRASDLLLPGNDFWVFDDRLVLWNHFTGEGEVSPEGWEMTEDPAQVKACAAAFESVWDRAVPHGDYRPA